MLNCHPMVSFGEPLGHVITLRGQILVSRTDDDFFLFSFVFFLLCVWCVGGGRKGVSTFKTPSVCRFKKRPRVCRHHAQIKRSTAEQKSEELSVSPSQPLHATGNRLLHSKKKKRSATEVRAIWVKTTQKESRISQVNLNTDTGNQRCQKRL